MGSTGEEDKFHGRAMLTWHSEAFLLTTRPELGSTARSIAENILEHHLSPFPVATLPARSILHPTVVIDIILSLDLFSLTSGPGCHALSDQ